MFPMIVSLKFLKGISLANKTLAILGRPNVGKSTLFNRLVGTRKSIVSPVEGVTRDRIYSTFDWLENNFDIIDTGGFLPKEKDIINKRHGKLIYYNEKEEPKIKYDPKGAICFGRKFDQTKLSKETKNQFYKFQEEEIIQNIKDIKKYENLSDFSEEKYSRWNV